MKRIAYGIGVLAIALCTCNLWAETAQDIKTEVLTKTGSSWDGKLLPKYPRGRPEIQILRIKIPAGAQLPLHKHNVINAGVLIQGELTVVTKDNRILHLKAGDPIVEVVNTWHSGKNEGTGDAVIIVFYAGTPGTFITTKEGSIKSNLRTRSDH